MDVADLFRTSVPTYQTAQCHSVHTENCKLKITTYSFCTTGSKAEGDLWCHDVCIVDDAWSLCS
jgi:hypothetical protein